MSTYIDQFVPVIQYAIQLNDIGEIHLNVIISIICKEEKQDFILLDFIQITMKISQATTD